MVRGVAALTAASLGLCAAVAGTSPARATDDFADAATAKVPYTRTLARPTTECAKLAGRSLGGDATVSSAAPVAARSGVPAFCDVQGVVAPSIRFDVALPLVWNARLYALGNAGCGDVLSDNFGDRDIGLQHGFAVASTDTGIENPNGDCAWAFERPDLAVDFAYAGVHATAVAAKTLIGLFYGRTPLASYFNGCSDGGHDALEEVQKYPADFDGVVAGAPFLGAGTIVAGAWEIDAFSSLPASEAMTPAKAAYVASVVYAKCDALDGLADGVIEDPQACAGVFKPSRDLALCAEGSDASNCLTPRQLAAYEKALGPTLSHGTAYYPGQPLGDEVEYAGNLIPAAGKPLSSTQAAFYTTTYMRYLFPWPKTDTLEFSPATFDFDTDPERIEAFRTMFDPADLDLAPFIARGGKLLAYHGLADPLISAYGTVALYDDERARYGSALAENFIFFPVPGMGHCAGGPGADMFDPMTAVIDWYEAREAPREILSRRFGSGATLRFTRTLCPYPETSRYTGTNPNLASSFTCVAGTPGVPGTDADGGLALP